jgi:hypothetical protein
VITPINLSGLLTSLDKFLCTALCAAICTAEAKVKKPESRLRYLVRCLQSQFASRDR